MSGAGYCVCVPARDEEARLPILLDVLAGQDVAGPIPIAICINDSVDRSAEIARDHPAVRSGRLAIALDECRLPRGAAHVGTARRRAMAAGLALAGDDGVLLSTDADCRPPPSWIAANLAAFARGADLVGGRIEIDDGEPLEPALAAVRARFDRYWADVRAIEDAIDPQPHDPPPRHGDHTGASLAIRAALYRAAGGVPAIASGEDRALVVAALAAGGRLTHPVDVWTRASPRTAGRATGGMADAMADLRALLDAGRDPLVPDFMHWRRRAAWRAAERSRGVDVAVREAALPAMPCDMPLPALR